MYLSKEKLLKWKNNLEQFDFEDYTKNRIPILYKLLFTGKFEHITLKKWAGFIYGFILGLIFYLLVLTDLNFMDLSGILLGLFISLMLAFGNAFSSQIRCITLLSFPKLGGRSGRGVLKTLVLAYVISGPIQNLSRNAKEVVRVFGCTTSLTYNLTKSRYELMFKPFGQALFGMKTDLNEIKDTLRSIRDVSAPLIGEIEDESEIRKLKEENDYLDTLQGDSKRSDDLDKKYQSKSGDQYEKRYMKKIELRCEEQFSKASLRCRKSFGQAYDSCEDAVGSVASWLLCWPMKLTFVCNIAQVLGGSSKCDPSKDLDPGFGEGYVHLKKSRADLARNFKDVKLQYRIPKIENVYDYQDAQDTAKAIMHDVESKKFLIDYFLGLFKKLLAFIFLRIIVSAQNYHDQYLRDIQFDNIYVTSYFKKIDARRHAREQHTLLPLKKIERLKLVEPLSLKPLKNEQEELLGQTIKLILEMIAATTFVILDRLFFEALDIVRRHSKIDYVQKGHHDLSLKIEGTGMIASLLRSVIKNFNVKQRIRSVRSNEACLPQPTLLAKHFLYKIYGTYFIVWILILMQAFTQRLNRTICAYFYRKREKRRVLFLYNDTLKRRVGFFRYMKKKVKKLARETRLQENLNICQVFRVRFPEKCSWLQFFATARRKCIICKDPEPKSQNFAKFVKCTTPNCYVVYCQECWKDMGEQCFACAEESSDSSDLRDSDEGFGLTD